MSVAPKPGAAVRISRREFLKAGVAAGAGFVLGIRLISTADSGTDDGPAAPFEPNAFVRVGADDTVTVIVKHLEMGQGTYTGLPTLVAEEMDAAWSQIRAEGAPADAKLYRNLFWGQMQGTGGSTAMANSFLQMRKAGAVAREMLVNAAARQWNVPVGEIDVRDGVVRHEVSGRSAGFGELAALAARQPLPGEVFLKDPEDFRLIGAPLPRKDAGKTDGSAVFTQDIRLPGMLVAMVAHPPRFGARVRSFDARRARKVPGVVDVVQIPTGVAVLARDTWSAQRGRDALAVQWDEADAFGLGSEEIMAEYRRLATRPGEVAQARGDAALAMAGASRVLEASYEFPYLAHAAMEPMDCVVSAGGDGVEIWNGVQSQTADQRAVARVFGLQPGQVRINMLYAGGSFGRRANPDSDYVVEAATIVRAIGSRAPVKLVWTREDDMRAGYYRPMFLHTLKAGLDRRGRPVAWQHRLVGQPILEGIRLSVEGAANLPYAIPDMTVDVHSPRMGVPVQWWRSVASTHTAYSTETFMDELALADGKDPVSYRLDLLGDHPRHRAVLELAAGKARWGSPLPRGRGRGVAVHKSFGTCVAQVAEVTAGGDGDFSVDRVVIAVDCGLSVNPDVVRAQMEGGMGFGLAAALSGEITLREGRVVQSNFHDYPVLRMDRMPAVEVYIVDSGESPTGVGEPATPVIAPAVANALFAATGRRIYRLPFRRMD